MEDLDLEESQRVMTAILGAENLDIEGTKQACER